VQGHQKEEAGRAEHAQHATGECSTGRGKLAGDRYFPANWPSTQTRETCAGVLGSTFRNDAVRTGRRMAASGGNLLHGQAALPVSKRTHSHTHLHTHSRARPHGSLHRSISCLVPCGPAPVRACAPSLLLCARQVCIKGDRRMSLATAIHSCWMTWLLPHRRCRRLPCASGLHAPHNYTNLVHTLICATSRPRPPPQPTPPHRSTPNLSIPTSARTSTPPIAPAPQHMGRAQEHHAIAASITQRCRHGHQGRVI
jgi:hypothetical protein